MRRARFNRLGYTTRPSLFLTEKKKQPDKRDFKTKLYTFSPFFVGFHWPDSKVPHVTEHSYNTLCVSSIFRATYNNGQNNLGVIYINI